MRQIYFLVIIMDLVDYFMTSQYAKVSRRMDQSCRYIIFEKIKPQNIYL